MTTCSQKTEPVGSEGPLLWAIAVTVFLILSLLLLVNSMNKPPARDEQMYCTAGVLLSQGYTPYKDFAYVSQLPYHPLLLSWVYRLSSTTHYLLAARLVTVACEMMSLLCIMAIFRSILRPYRKHAAGLSIVAMILYVVNPIVFMANGYAWNHGVVVFLVLLALTILLRSPTSRDPSPHKLRSHNRQWHEDYDPASGGRDPGVFVAESDDFPKAGDTSTPGLGSRDLDGRALAPLDHRASPPCIPFGSHTNSPRL